MTDSSKFDNDTVTEDTTASDLVLITDGRNAADRGPADRDLDARIDAMFAASSFGEPESVEAAAIGARARARRAARWTKPCSAANTGVESELLDERSDAAPTTAVPVRAMRNAIQRAFIPMTRKTVARLVELYLANGAVGPLAEGLIDSLQDSDSRALAAHQLAVLIRQGGEIDLAEALITYGRSELPWERLAQLRNVETQARRRAFVDSSQADGESLFFAACDAHVRSEFGVALTLYRAALGKGQLLASVGVESLTVEAPRDEADSAVPSHNLQAFADGFADGYGLVWNDLQQRSLRPSCSFDDQPEGGWGEIRISGIPWWDSVRRSKHDLMREVLSQSWSDSLALLWHAPMEGISGAPILRRLTKDVMPRSLTARGSGPMAVGAPLATEAVEYLVALASEGRRGGVDQLLQLAFPVVARYCRSRLLDLPAADRSVGPVAAEVCEEVVRALPRARAARQDFVSLVYQTCVEKVDSARSRLDGLGDQRPGRWLIECKTFQGEASAEECSASPARIAAGLVNHLRPKEREVLVLVLVGLSDEQGAKAVDLELPKFRAAHYRGLQEMLEMLTRELSMVESCTASRRKSAVDAVNECVSETLRRVWSGSS